MKQFKWSWHISHHQVIFHIIIMISWHNDVLHIIMRYQEIVHIIMHFHDTCHNIMTCFTLLGHYHEILQIMIFFVIIMTSSLNISNIPFSFLTIIYIYTATQLIKFLTLCRDACLVLRKDCSHQERTGQGGLVSVHLQWHHRLQAAHRWWHIKR